MNSTWMDSRSIIWSWLDIKTKSTLFPSYVLRIQLQDTSLTYREDFAVKYLKVTKMNSFWHERIETETKPKSVCFAD